MKAKSIRQEQDFIAVELTRTQAEVLMDVLTSAIKLLPEDDSVGISFHIEEGDSE